MVTRISGLASGMDIDSMVKNMLSVDRIKVDKVSQNKQKLEWKQQLYNDINKDLANFLINARKELGLSKTTSTGQNLNLGISSIGWHKSATSSDDTKVTAKVSGTSSFSGTHKIDVERMAVGVTATSSEAIGKTNWTAGSDFSFDVNGKTVEVKSGDGMSTVAKKISSSGAGVKASYDSSLDRFFLQTDAVGSSAKLEITNPTGDAANFISSLNLEIDNKSAKGTTLDIDNVYSGVSIDSTEFITSNSIRGSKSYGMGYSGTINIGAEEISIDKTDSIADIVKKIETNTDIEVTTGVDVDGKVIFEFKNTSLTELTISGTSGGETFLNDIFSTVPANITAGDTVNSDKALANPMALGQAGTIAVNGNPITISAEHTMEDVLKKLNGAGVDGLSASFDYLTGKLSLTNGTLSDITITDGGNVMQNLFKSPPPANISANSTSTGDAIADEIRGLGHSGTITVNNESLTINPEDSISDIIGKLDLITGVTATYSDVDGSVSIKYDGNLNFSGTDAGGKTFLDALNIKISAGSVAGEVVGVGTVYSGMDGLVKYNDIESAVSSNTFTFNGINFTAKDVTSGTPVNITVATDAEAAMDKIKNFVEEYNKMIEKAGSLINEKANRNYQPLTDEQKEAMTEKEVELWEGRAKKGLLYRDDSINKTLSNLRGSLYDKLKDASGTFSHISDIGITTEKYTSGSVGGKLTIDETKLRAALNADADSVLEVLFKDGSADDITTTGNVKEDPRGVFNRISDNLIDGMKDIIDRSGTGDSSDLFRNIKSNMLIDFITGNNMSKQGSISMIDKNILDINKQMDSLNSWLFNRENAYYARFTAMEKAMQNASNQSSWLMQQMGS